MSDTTGNAAPKKGGPMKMLVPLIGGLVLLGAGAGGGFFAASSGMMGGGSHKKADSDKPQHVERAEGEEPHQVDEDGDGQYETSYFELKKEFTANLMDPNRYIQVGLGVATTYDSKVTEAVEKNEPAIRSAVLGVLAEQTAEGVATVAGKEALQRRLRGVINQTLEGKTGFGGISQVYFTSFVIQ
jgi:flagellar FliL protein